MGKLARLVDGIKERLQGGAGGGKKKEAAAAACYEYEKVDKTDSMRVEIRSRRARQLIAKNLATADAIAGSSPRGGGVGGGKGKKKKKKKKRFLAF